MPQINRNSIQKAFKARIKRRSGKYKAISTIGIESDWMDSEHQAREDLQRAYKEELERRRQMTS